MTHTPALAPIAQRCEAVELQAIQARCDAATKGPLTVCVIPTDVDQAALLAKSLSYGSGEVFVVMIDNHPGTNGSAGAAMCVTGNGPTSEANADFIAHARTDVETLLAEVTALRGVLAQIAALPSEQATVWRPEGVMTVAAVDAAALHALLDAGGARVAGGANG